MSRFLLGQFNSWLGQTILVLALQLEAGLLFVAANTGFVAGPSVLANMSVDGWLPKRFQYLSKRLVVQNGLVLFGVAAGAVLFWTKGHVSLLVVLYSINVFIAFSLSLLGVAVFWIRHRTSPRWFWHFAFSLFACLITTGILVITLIYKFTAGGWATLLITAIIVAICMMINRHYRYIKSKLTALDVLLKQPISDELQSPLVLDPQDATAIIFVNSLSVGMHTLLSIMRLFPRQFKNYVFLCVGEVDTESFRGEVALERMKGKVDGMLDYFVKYCLEYQIPAESYSAFGTDLIQELENLADRVGAQYPRGIYFTSRLVFADENVIKWYLHNQVPLLLQQYLHYRGKELMILPMKI